MGNGRFDYMQDWSWDTRTWGLNLKWKVATCNVSHQFPMKNGEDDSRPGLSRMGTTAESYTRDWVRQKMLLEEPGTDVI